MNKKRNLDHYERGFNAAEKWEIVLQLIIFIAALFVVMTLTRRLRLAIDRKTQSYVTDVALQNAYRIEEKLQVLQQDLELIKAHVNDELPSHQPIFLQEAAALLGFDSLVIHANDSETGVIVRENQQIDVTVALDEQPAADRLDIAAADAADDPIPKLRRPGVILYFRRRRPGDHFAHVAGTVFEARRALCGKARRAGGCRY